MCNHKPKKSIKRECVGIQNHTLRKKVHPTKQAYHLEEKRKEKQYFKKMTTIKLAGIILLLGVICSTNASSCSYPKWPKDFKWSSAGPINGMVCTQILEPNDPHTWTDNFFCHKSDHGMQGLGMRWSHKGTCSRCYNYSKLPINIKFNDVCTGKIKYKF